jgi:hypothetical protein
LTVSPTPEPTEAAPCIADAEFDGDVTIRDGTVIGAGQPFTGVARAQQWDLRLIPPMPWRFPGGRAHQPARSACPRPRQGRWWMCPYRCKRRPETANLRADGSSSRRTAKSSE